MKNVFICLAILCVFTNTYAQEHNINCISHTEDRTTTIRITDDADLDALQVFEKLKFLKKKLSIAKSIYFNAQGNFNTTSKFISHKNVFPGWYIPPTENTSTENGILTYYDTDNPYLTGGWPGGGNNLDRSIEYGMDQNTRRRYGFRRYDQKLMQEYDIRNLQVQQSGLLTFYSFNPPDKQELEEFERLGYRIYTDKDIITVENTDLLLTWNLNQYTVTQTKYEAGSIIKTITSSYLYNQFFMDHLIANQQIVNYLLFTTGDCYEEVVNTYYHDYNNDCEYSNNTMPRSADKTDSNFTLSIYPNPTDRYITIGLPPYNNRSTLEIRDLSGKLIMSKSTLENETTLTVDLSKYPSGVFLIRLIQGDTILSKKFVKI